MKHTVGYTPPTPPKQGTTWASVEVWTLGMLPISMEVNRGRHTFRELEVPHGGPYFW